VARNLIRNNSIVYGCGSVEIACSIAVEAAADRYPKVEQSMHTINTQFNLFWSWLKYNHYDAKLLVLANRHF
jgi:hypothetical protein